MLYQRLFQKCRLEEALMDKNLMISTQVRDMAGTVDLTGQLQI